MSDSSNINKSEGSPHLSFLKKMLMPHALIFGVCIGGLFVWILGMRPLQNSTAQFNKNHQQKSAQVAELQKQMDDLQKRTTSYEALDKQANELGNENVKLKTQLAEKTEKIKNLQETVADKNEMNTNPSPYGAGALPPKTVEVAPEDKEILDKAVKSKKLEISTIFDSLKTENVPAIIKSPVAVAIATRLPLLEISYVEDSKKPAKLTLKDKQGNLIPLKSISPILVPPLCCVKAPAN